MHAVIQPRGIESPKTAAEQNSAASALVVFLQSQCFIQCINQPARLLWLEIPFGGMDGEITKPHSLCEMNEIIGIRPVLA